LAKGQSDPGACFRVNSHLATVSWSPLGAMEQRVAAGSQMEAHLFKSPPGLTVAVGAVAVRSDGSEACG